jgi:hypothetical protein
VAGMTEIEEFSLEERMVSSSFPHRSEYASNSVEAEKPLQLYFVSNNLSYQPRGSYKRKSLQKNFYNPCALGVENPSSYLLSKRKFLEILNFAPTEISPEFNFTTRFLENLKEINYKLKKILKNSGNTEKDKYFKVIWIQGCQAENIFSKEEVRRMHHLQSELQLIIALAMENFMDIPSRVRISWEKYRKIIRPLVEVYTPFAKKWRQYKIEQLLLVEDFFTCIGNCEENKQKRSRRLLSYKERIDKLKNHPIEFEEREKYIETLENNLEELRVFPLVWAIREHSKLIDTEEYKKEQEFLNKFIEEGKKKLLKKRYKLALARQKIPQHFLYSIRKKKEEDIKKRIERGEFRRKERAEHDPSDSVCEESNALTRYTELWNSTDFLIEKAEKLEEWLSEKLKKLFLEEEQIEKLVLEEIKI